MADHRWNSLVIILAAVVLAAIIGFAAGSSFGGGCPELKDAPFGCFEWWLARYQTLIAMGVAIMLAWFAAQPVWRQLRLTSLQTTMTLQQVLRVREKLLADRASMDMRILDKLDEEMNRGYHDREGDRGTLSHWVWDMESLVGTELVRLNKRQEENLDGDETTIARQLLIQALMRLANCMSDYNGLVHFGFDIEISDTPELRTEIERLELAAEAQLPCRIDEMSAAIGGLRKAFNVDLGEVRLKRQLMDQIVINADVS
jgi:hypothetical protein